MMQVSANKLPSYVYIYFFCQALSLMVGVSSVSMAAIVGKMIAPDPLYATVPFGLQHGMLFIAAYPIAMIMKRYGRKIGFTLGASSLAVAGIIGFLAVSEKNFLLLIIAHCLIGLSIACAAFYRYAATDNLSKELHSKALSMVVGGGVLAGFLAPELSIFLQGIKDFPRFSLNYGVFMTFAMLILLLIYTLPAAKTKNNLAEKTKPSATKSTSRPAVLLTAICFPALGYGMMSLLMIQTTLRMNQMQFTFEDTSFSIQWHVVAMFAPSFFTGKLIARLGHLPIITTGYILFVTSFLFNILFTNHLGITSSLIFLGLAWNFSYVGGSSLLTYLVADSPNSHRWQGIADSLIALSATIGAFAPSFMLGLVGWEMSNILVMVMCIIPFTGLFWFKLNKQKLLATA